MSDSSDPTERRPPARSSPPERWRDGAAATVPTAGAEPGWERIQATKHCFVLAETLAAAGKAKQSAGIYRYLMETRTDPKEAYIRQAAQRALEVDKDRLV